MNKKIPYREIFGLERLSYYPTNRKYIHNSDNATISDDEDDE
jgi:hypothetical protein